VGLVVLFVVGGLTRYPCVAFWDFGDCSGEAFAFMGGAVGGSFLS
jgi:hypothetical protein